MIVSSVSRNEFNKSALSVRLKYVYKQLGYSSGCLDVDLIKFESLLY